MRILIEADGGSRGNPGIAAGGAVVLNAETGELLAECGVFVGHATNNVAEYSGMIAGISRAFEIDPAATLLVRMDSKLVVEQMMGRWKIKNPAMADLARSAREIIGSRSVSFEWVPRLQNSRADALANESMDSQSSFAR